MPRDSHVSEEKSTAELNQPKLCRFHWDCGRQGSIEGVFIATEEEISRVVGKDLYFGEVLGEHSEICGLLRDNDVERLSIPASDAEVLSRYPEFICSGFDPLEYVPCVGCEEHGERLPASGLCSYCSKEAAE